MITYYLKSFGIFDDKSSYPSLRRFLKLHLFLIGFQINPFPLSHVQVVKDLVLKTILFKLLMGQFYIFDLLLFQFLHIIQYLVLDECTVQWLIMNPYSKQLNEWIGEPKITLFTYIYWILYLLPKYLCSFS